MRDITPDQIKANNVEADRILAASGSIDHSNTYPYTAQKQGDNWGVFNAKTSEFTPMSVNTPEYAEEMAGVLKKKHYPAPGSAATYNPRG